MSCAPTDVSVNPSDLGLPGTQAAKRLVICLLLFLITVLLYTRAASCDFINFDDPQYVLNNPHVRTGLTWETVKWALTAYDVANWHPLTWLSHALDVQLFRLNPAGHHCVNVVIHAIDAMLLFLLLLSVTGRAWLSWMVAALWAVHPVNVESVAWVAERRNVLSMFFFLLAMYAYGWYAQKPKMGRYLTVTLLFALGLMSKAQIITLPFVLLLWDYWPLRRLMPETVSAENRSFSWLLLEKLPLLLLSAGSALLTIQAQYAGNGVRSVSEFSFSSRIANALVSYVRYIEIAFWPAHLSPIYPHPENSIPSWEIVSAVIFLVLVTAFVLWKKDRRYLAVGWFWYLGTLVPMIGLLQVGQQGMADRYAYLPLIGLLLIVVWGGAEALQRSIGSAAVAATSAAAIIALSVVTYQQLGYWRNSETLWKRALAVTRNNYMAHGNLADALARQGRSEEAILHFEAAARLHQYQPFEILTLGMYEQQNGHAQGAIELFKEVLRSPDLTIRGAALVRLGSAYRQLGKLDLARQSYADALRFNSNDPDALIGSGLLAYQNDPQSAVVQFSRAATIQPSDTNLLLLAAALRSAGRTAEAAAAAERAGRISKDWTRAQEVVDGLVGPDRQYPK